MVLIDLLSDDVDVLLGRPCVVIHKAAWFRDLFHDAQTSLVLLMKWVCLFSAGVCEHMHVNLCAHCFVSLMSCCHICFQDGTVFSYAHPGTQV